MNQASASRKKDAIQFGIAVCLALIFGIAAYFLVPTAAKFKAQYYNYAPFIILQSYLLPAFWLFLGWAILQGAGLLGIICPVWKPFRKPVHIILLILLVLYAVLLLPFIVDQLINLTRSLRFQHDPSLYPGGLSYTSHLPDFLMNISGRIINAVFNRGAVFILPGLILWLTKPTTSK